MNNKIFNRHTCIGLVSLIILITCIWFRLSPSKISNFTTLMSDTISFASFITCLMFIGLAYLPSQDNSKFMRAMEDLRTNITIMHQILITISIWFTISVICLLALALAPESWLAILLSSIWLSLLISGVLEVTSLLFELFRIIIYIAQQHAKDVNNGY